MNAEPGLIDNDDVDMDCIILIDDDDDDDKINCKGTNDIPTIETIDLDNESPIINIPETVTNDVKEKKKKKKKSEKSFINNLNNNRLMDKIVTRCLNMENAIGMPRVIYKTLLPLYANTDNRFKESKLFRKLLKKTYKLLTRDPDHKFLHIKTLCEEMKSGVFRRKVPFVTLATNLQNNGVHWENREIKSSSRPMNGNGKEKPNRFDANLSKYERFCKVTTENNNKRKNNRTTVVKKTEGLKTCDALMNKDKIQPRTTSYVLRENTDVIYLDISDNEFALDNGDGRNDIIIIDETELSENKSDDSSKTTQEIDSNKATHEIDTNETSLEIDTNETSLENDTNETSLVNDTNETSLENDTNETSLENDTNETSLENDISKASIEEGDYNKENYLIENEGHKKSEDELDYELLIPQNQVEAIVEIKDSPAPKVDFIKVENIEKEIASYKRQIAELEETEVNLDSAYSSSPYVQCSKLKKKIVDCYKKLYEMHGNSEDIVKRSNIRLHVVEGHPPGPAKMLEQFLNDSVECTGTVSFPDFSDVVKCVVQACLIDSLGWDRQRVLQEAAALFRQCGQALRKRRQKREYRDLLSLVRDKNHTDDPAERDPALLAKLEQNQLIARKREDEILERYVNMENNMSSEWEVVNHRVGNIVEFESDQYSSDSDSDTELNVRLSNNTIVTTTTINNQFRIENSLTISNDINNLDVTVTAKINNQCEIEEFSKNNYISNNNLDVTPKNKVDVILTTPINEKTTNSKNNNAINLNENAEVLVINKTCNLSDKQNDVACTSEEVVAHNNDPSILKPEDIKIEDNSMSEPIDVQRMLNELEDNFVCTVINKTCNLSDKQNDVACTSEEFFAHNNDPSMIKPEDIKIEDNSKSGPIDVQRMLDELGDNFVCTVFDIEDPFLVIEISSDGFSEDEL